MAPTLPEDFAEFLKSLNARGVRYLVIGGYAVGFHGYPRATDDLDIWIGPGPDNAARAASALRDFGFTLPDSPPESLFPPDRIVRMGMPPMRIEMASDISGVEFETCYPQRALWDCGGLSIPLIGLDDLKTNKRASGRHKDLADLDYLP